MKAPTEILAHTFNAERKNAGIDLLFPWPLQPRTEFDETYIKELSGMIAKHGLLNDLIVRPRKGHPGEYEILGGECRWRACKLAGLKEVSIKVSEMSDGDALELALVDNMKRKDLSVMEESAAFQRALAQTDGGGALRYPDKQALADAIGVSESYVRQRVDLAKLTPAGQKALKLGTKAGGISFSTARVICECPVSIVAKFEDAVLNSKKWGYDYAPLNAEDAQELKHAEFVQQLQGAAFNQADPNLVPLVETPAGERLKGGACDGCTWNSATGRDDSKKGQGRGRVAGDGKFCFNPACYQEKVEVHVAGELVRAKEQGARILNADETAQMLANSSGYVKLAEKLGPDDRAKGITDKTAPTWEKVIDGIAKPEVLACVDRKGAVHCFVERKLAIAAAQKNGTDKLLNLSSGRARSVQEDDAAEQRKKDNAKQALKKAQSRHIIAELEMQFRHKVGSDGADFALALLPLAARHGGHAGCHYVAKRREIEIPKASTGHVNASMEEVVVRFGTKLPPEELPGLVFELLLSQDFANYLSPHTTDFIPRTAQPLLKFFSIDAAAIMKGVERDFADRKKASGEKQPKGETLAGLRFKLHKIMKERSITMSTVEALALKVASKRYDDIKAIEEMRKLLAAVEEAKPKPTPSPKKKAARTAKLMTPEVRARLAAKVKARWAKLEKKAGKVAKKTSKKGGSK